VDEEAGEMMEGIGDEELAAEFEEAWGKAYADLAYFPSRKAFGRLSQASKADRIAATAHVFNTTLAAFEKDRKKVGPA
jgi:hypothetical protein